MYCSKFAFCVTTCPAATPVTVMDIRLGIKEHRSFIPKYLKDRNPVIFFSRNGKYTYLRRNLKTQEEKNPGICSLQVCACSKVVKCFQL